MGRVLTVVRALVRGRTVDRHSASELLKMTPEAADRFLRTFVKHWPEVAGEADDGTRLLRWSASGIVPDSIAVAACFGASLSRLFEGSNYESGLRAARQRIVARVRRPELFDQFDRKFYFVRGGGEMMLPEKAEYLDEVVDAVLRRNHLSMRYRPFDRDAESVRIKPLSIAVYAHQLYVIGRDERNVDHPFRFSRIVHVEREETTFAYPSKSDYDPERLFADSFGIFVGSEFPVEDVQLKFAARWSTFVDHHRWHKTQRVEQRADGIVLRMRVRVCPELEAWILGFGEEVEVLAPAGLRKVIGAKLAAGADVYDPRRTRRRQH